MFVEFRAQGEALSRVPRGREVEVGDVLEFVGGQGGRVGEFAEDGGG